jgi:hypothetical protein
MHSATFTINNEDVMTASIFVKAAEIASCYLQAVINSSFPPGQVSFDLSTQQLTNVGTAVGFIEDVGSGWFRIGYTQTATSTSTTNKFQIALKTLSENPYLGNGTDGIYLWGAQLEVSASPTTYIPTTTVAASVTGVTHTGNFQDDVHTSLETVLQTTGATPDLWKRYKELT